jgi:hypothetical protein
VRGGRKVERSREQLLVDARVVFLDRRNQLVDEVLVMPFDVDHSHTLSVLTTSAGETAAEDSTLQDRTMPSVTLADRRRERKARKLARLLVALDETARASRNASPRRSLRASLGGAR